VSSKKQLIDDLYEVRALAAHISQGEFRAKDLNQAQQELSRRLSIAVQNDTAAGLADTPDSSVDDLRGAPGASRVAASLTQAAAESTAAAEVFRQRFSVDSIDAFIGVVSRRV
jgi:hypothetical protein